MSIIINKSNILNWSADFINTAPTNPGVYVLRNIPSLNGIIYIGSTENLKIQLLEYFTNNNMPETLWFDWYQTKSFEEAQKLQQVWASKYTPKYNSQ